MVWRVIEKIMEAYIEIGHTKKTYGVNGELKVHIEEHFQEDFREAGVLFLEIQGGQVPFFIENQREAGAWLVKLDEVDTPEEAVPLTGKKIFLRREDLRHTDGEGEEVSDLRLLEGFTIVDKEAGVIGGIEEVIELPQQLTAVVEYEGREVLIPLSEELITGVHPEEQVIEMDLPEGLLDL